MPHLVTVQSKAQGNSSLSEKMVPFGVAVVSSENQLFCQKQQPLATVWALLLRIICKSILVAKLSFLQLCSITVTEGVSCALLQPQKVFSALFCHVVVCVKVVQVVLLSLSFCHIITSVKASAFSVLSIEWVEQLAQSEQVP